VPGPLPPVGFPHGSLPLVERLRFKDLEESIQPILELIEQITDLDEIDDDFWSAFNALDQRVLVEPVGRGGSRHDDCQDRAPAGTE